MAQYDYLPEELGRLFGDSLIPPEIRELLSSGWDRMKSNEQGQLLNKLRKERDKLKCILIAVIESSKVLLSQPPNEVKF